MEVSCKLADIHLWRGSYIYILEEPGSLWPPMSLRIAGVLCIEHVVAVVGVHCGVNSVRMTIKHLES